VRKPDGSIIVDCTTYLSTIGFDEEFVGCGGEDIEFWETAQSLNVYIIIVFCRLSIYGILHNQGKHQK